MIFRTFYRTISADKETLVETDSRNQAFRRMPDGGAVWKITAVYFAVDKKTK